MEFRERSANDRAAALEAKYDPDDDIAMRRLGAPIEASAFLTNFAKNLKGDKASKAMGGDV